PTLEEKIVRWQPKDHELRRLAKKVRCESGSDYTFRNHDMLVKDKRLCVP
ncbi:hypothetical protein Csa_018380, partial [Cucumis sativus]